MIISCRVKELLAKALELAESSLNEVCGDDNRTNEETALVGQERIAREVFEPTKALVDEFRRRYPSLPRPPIGFPSTTS